MKATIFTITMFCLLAVLAGCNKYLENDQPGVILEEDLYSDKENIYGALNGIYITVASRDLYGHNLTFGSIEFLGQHFAYLGGALTREREFLFSFTGFSSATNTVYGPILENTWGTAYECIRLINQFIQNIEPLNTNLLQKEEKDMLMGEALGLRALLHFDLLRVFGTAYKLNPDIQAIPYITKVVQDGAQPLLTTRHVLDAVINDLKTAATFLSADPVITKGGGLKQITSGEQTPDFWSFRAKRMNYFAVNTLLSRAYLYANQNALANETARKVITEMKDGFPWIASGNAALIDPAFSDETFFGITNYDLYTGFLEKYIAPGATLPEGFSMTEAALAYYWSNKNDFRYIAWLQEGVIMMPTSNYNRGIIMKFQRRAGPATTNTSLQYFQPLLKKSELYLILAETENDPVLARNYLNELRQYRGIDPLNSGINIQAALQDEYYREFLCEGQVFGFLKRNVITSIRNYASTVGATAYLNISARNYTAPLPLPEINGR